MDFLSFSKILGQERAVRVLRGVILRDKIPHGYLFLGMRGVGKTSTAAAMAQALNCLEPFQGDGCGRCRNCKWLAAGNFADFILVNPEGLSIKIEQIRELERKLSFKPQHGRYRVTVLRGAERLTEEASNAFLKTLEEPPPGNILILNASDPSQLLPTIVSRCQKVFFGPLSVELISDWLVREKGVETGQAAVLARLSEGSLGKALQMWEDDYLLRREDLLSKLMSLPSLTIEDTLRMAVELSGKGKRDVGKGPEGAEEVQILLSLWKTWIRDLLVLGTGGEEGMIVNVDYRQVLKKAVRAVKIDNLIKAFGLLEGAEKDTWHYRNVDLLMEHLLLGLKRLLCGPCFNGTRVGKDVTP